MSVSSILGRPAFDWPAREGLFGFQDFHFTADRLELRAFSKTHSGGDGPMHVLDGREILLASEVAWANSKSKTPV